MKSKEVDLDMERLIRSAEGPSLSKEFEELLKSLKTSLNDNHFKYKKALDKTINFIRVIKVNKDNFLEEKIVVNANDSGTDRCMQVSLNCLISRRASELDIFISKVRFITSEDTMLLTTLRDAQVAAFPEAYLQPSKGSKGGEKKKEDDKKDEEKKRRGERKSRKPHDDSETQTTLKIQTQSTQTSAQPTISTISNIKPSQTSKPKFLYKQTSNSFLKIPITSSQINLKKMTTLPLSKPSLKFKHKFVGRKPKKVKPTKKVEVTERAICNCFKESDFLPLNWCSSDEDHFQYLADEIIRDWIVSLREVRIYFEDGKDTITRAWRSSLSEERRRRHDEEIHMYIKRLEELKAKGMSRISKDGRFLNIRAGGFSRFCIEVLDQVYPKDELTEFLKKEEILRKQLKREQEVIKAWKSSRNSTDDEAYPSKAESEYTLKDKDTHSLIEKKPISKAKLAKLNEKYGSVSKNFVTEESSRVKDTKRVNVGHLSMKQLNDRLEKIEGNRKSLWYLDSGCSKHMTGDSTLLTKFMERGSPSITFADDIKGQVNNHPDLKVRRPSSDNETEFKNSAMRLFYEENGIMHEFSAARTPQQNRVVERKNDP
ncbi:hypothetical protein AgCh_013393 [Apium graveolens]